MIESLDEICPDNGFLITREGSAFSPDRAAPVLFASPRGANEIKRYKVTFSNLTRTEFLDIVEFFEGKGFTRAFEWTPPDADTQAFIFDAFEAQAETGAMAAVECSLLRVPGVPVAGGGGFVGNAIEVLGTFEGVNLNTTVGELIYTAAASVVIVGFLIRPTAAEGVVDAPVLTFGIHPAEDDLVGGVMMPGLGAVGHVWALPIFGRSRRLSVGSSIRIKVQEAATADSLISDVDILGYRV